MMSLDEGQSVMKNKHERYYSRFTDKTTWATKTSKGIKHVENTYSFSTKMVSIAEHLPTVMRMKSLKLRDHFLKH